MDKFASFNGGHKKIEKADPTEYEAELGAKKNAKWRIKNERSKEFTALHALCSSEAFMEEQSRREKSEQKTKHKGEPQVGNVA